VCGLACQPETARARKVADPSTYQEDIDGTCFEGGLNSLSDFLKGFGIDLG